MIQIHVNGAKKPLGHWSRTLNATEKNYDRTHWELLALFLAILFLRAYMEGRTLIFRTDHDALILIFNLTNCTGRLGRGTLHLSESDFGVVHSARIKTTADALSQLETGGTKKTLFRNDIAGRLVSLVQYIDHTTTSRTPVRPTKAVYVKSPTSPSVHTQRFNGNSINYASKGSSYMDRRSSDPVKVRQVTSCKQIASSHCTDRRTRVSCYFYDPDGIKIKTAPVDGSPQKDFSVTLHAHLIFFSLIYTGQTRHEETFVRQHATSF